VLEDAVHELKNAPRVIDIRNAGMAAGIDIEPDPAAPGRRGYDALRIAFADENLVIRVSGDTIALAPALIATETGIARMVDGVRATLARLT
jgi:beta-alanine--pyruvate transaminase